MPKVSIILTTYNGARHIAETIASVINQTCKNWELIIVDDGSTDNTCEIIGDIKDERIHLHRAGRTGINGKIKNIGLSKTSGTLIAFIDHDDLWASEKLEKQIAALENYPEAGFCLTGGYNFKKEGQPLDFFYKDADEPIYGSVFNSIFRSEIALFTQALLLRKECITVAGGFTEDRSFADVDFIIKLAWHYKAVIIHEPLIYRRLHEGNYNTQNWKKSYYESMETIHTHREKKMISSELAKEALFNLYINLGEKYLLHKKSGSAINAFFKAWSNKPLSITPLKKTGKAVLFFFAKQ